MTDQTPPKAVQNEENPERGEKWLGEIGQEILCLFSSCLQISDAREQRFTYLIEWLERLFGSRDFKARSEVNIGKPLADELFKQIRRLKGDAKPLKARENINEASRLLRNLQAKLRIAEEENERLRMALLSLRNGGCGRDRNQNFIGQNQRNNCECCDVVRENADEALSPQDE